MNPLVFRSFIKHAGLGVAAAELGGLGVLSVPGIRDLRNPQTTPEGKSKARWETAGLGALAAHPAYELGKAGLSKLRGIR